MSLSPNETGWGGGSGRAIVLGNFQCRGVLLIRIIVGQNPHVLGVGADGDCLHIFSLESHRSPSLW